MGNMRFCSFHAMTRLTVWNSSIKRELPELAFSHMRPGDTRPLGRYCPCRRYSDAYIPTVPKAATTIQRMTTLGHASTAHGPASPKTTRLEKTTSDIPPTRGY